MLVMLLFYLIVIFKKFTAMKIHEEAEDLAKCEVIMKATGTQNIQIEINSAISQIEDIFNEFDNQLQNASTDQFISLLKQSETAVASVVEAHRSTKDFPTRGNLPVHTCHR